MSGLIRPDEWKQDAPCRGLDHELFIGRRQLAGRRVCHRCPVLECCLWYAVSEELVESDLWGGLGPRSRQALLATVGRPEARRRFLVEFAWWRRNRAAVGGTPAGAK